MENGTNTAEIRFTTAPVDYDYAYVKNHGQVGKTVSLKSDTVRKVEIPSARLKYQCSRYNSGMHRAWTREELNEHVEEGLISLLTETEKDFEREVETFIDQNGLTSLLGLVANICGDKAAHVAEAWQEEDQAALWQKAFERIDRTEADLLRLDGTIFGPR